MTKRIVIILLVLLGIALAAIPFMTRAQSNDLPLSTPAAEVHPAPFRAEDSLSHDFETAAAWAWPSSSTHEIRVHYVNWVTASTYIFDFNKHELTFRDDFPGTRPATIPFKVK